MFNFLKNNVTKTTTKKVKWVTLDTYDKITEDLKKENIEIKYTMIISGRSDGKTTACLKRVLDNYVEKGEQGAFIRRLDSNYTGSYKDNLFSFFISTGYVNKITKGEWTDVKYWRGGWFLSRYNEEKGKVEMQPEPFMFAFAISTTANSRGASYSNVTTIVFDEFVTMSNEAELPDEFVTFSNLISTIMRQRDNVQIYLLGNNNTRFSTYFKEMGLYNTKDMELGELNVYTIATDLKDENGKPRSLGIIVHRPDISKEDRPSKLLFCFDNSKTKMITEGSWAIATYPRLPFKYDKKNTVFYFYIELEGQIIRGDVCMEGSNQFLYFYPKRDNYEVEENELLYQLSFSPSIYRQISPLVGINDMTKKIAQLIRLNKTFFANNEVGDIVTTYLEKSYKYNLFSI